MAASLSRWYCRRPALSTTTSGRASGDAISHDARNLSTDRRGSHDDLDPPGNALLISAIALGLSWVLANAAMLFELLRWVGAAYLIWLGIQAWRNAGAIGGLTPPRGGVNFRRGILVALSNPKTIAFFTAFLPQFIDPGLPAGRQLAIMCTVSVLLAALSDCAWAVAAGLGRAWFMKPARAKLLGRVAGLALVGGGVWLSLARRPA